MSVIWKIIISLFILNHAYSFELILPKSIEKPLDLLGIEYVNEIILGSYKKAGIDAKIVKVPHKRVLQGMDEGSYDSILFEIESNRVDKHYLKSSIPVVKDHKVFFFYRKNTKLKNMNIALVRGMGVPPETGEFHRKHKMITTETTDLESVAKMFRNNRIDGFFASKVTLSYVLNKKILHMDQLDSILIFKKNIYHYIHKKHQKIYDKINEEFKRLDKEKKFKFDDYLKRGKGSTKTLRPKKTAGISSSLSIPSSVKQS